MIERARSAAYAFGVGLFVVAVGCSSSRAVPPMTAVQKLNAEAVRRLDRGDVSAAELSLRDALREAELVDDLAGQAETWSNLGALAMARGRTDEAAACYAMALRIHHLRGVRDVGEVRVRSNLGSVLLAQGKSADARAQLEAAVTLSSTLNQPGSAFLARAGLAAVTLREGNAASAIEQASSLTRDARAKGDDEATAAALQVEGAARLSQHDHVGAHERLEQALDLDRRRESPASVVGDLRALAAVAEASGDHAQASSYLARASRAARRLGDLPGAESDLTRAIDHARAANAADTGALEIELAALKSRPLDP